MLVPFIKVQVLDPGLDDLEDHGPRSHEGEDEELVSLGAQIFDLLLKFVLIDGFEDLYDRYLAHSSYLNCLFCRKTAICIL